MYNVSEQLASANKAGVDTFMMIASASFAGVERLTALNLNAVRSMVEDSANTTRALLAVKDAEALVSLQNALAQPGSAKAATYTRRVVEIATQTQQALSQVVEAKVIDLNQDLGLALGKLARKAA